MIIIGGEKKREREGGREREREREWEREGERERERERERMRERERKKKEKEKEILPEIWFDWNKGHSNFIGRLRAQAIFSALYREKKTVY